MQLKSIESDDENNINITNLPITNSAMEVSESSQPEPTQLKTHLAEQEGKNVSNESPSSPDDLTVNPKSPDNSSPDSDTETHYKSLSNKKTKSRLILDDSDEEETLQNEETGHNNEEVEATVGVHKRIAVLDSDSDSEDSSAIAPHNKSLAKDENGEPVVYTTNLQGEIVPEDQQPKKSTLATLYDSDSEVEDTYTDLPQSPDNSKHSETKSKKSSITDETAKPVTVKDAQEQRKLIQSESQRMLREKHISLPYHKPKTHSLQEFLARRPKLSKATADLVKAPPSVAIKMSMDQLEKISKKLEEREKEVKEFYKSESESDGGEEDDKDYVPPTENIEVIDKKVNQPAEVVNSIEEVPPEVTEEHMELPEPSEASKADNSTETYQFNLDDIESGVIENSDTTKEPRTFTYTDLDKEIEDFGKPTKKSKLELLREQLANDKPKLTGSPDDIINLDEGSSRPREVEKLMERFAKHVQTHKKHHPQHKVKLSVVTVEPGGDILKEEVAMHVESDEEGPVVEEKPGAKLQKLKEELQRQMEQKKAEIWQLKAAKGLGETTEEGETAEKDILDDEDEEEMEWTDEEEEELEEDDIDLTDKPHKKSEFMDEEAEESDQDEAVADKEGYESGAEVESDTALESAAEEPEEEGKKRVLKRIIKPADDDSDDEDLFGESANLQPANLQLDSTITADEDEIPSHQLPPPRTPVRPQISQGKSINDFLTPISFITSIQNLNSASKGSVVSPFKMPSDLKSPIKSSTFSQKNLFSQSEASSLSISQPSFNPSTQMQSQDDTPTTQDLLEICSGQFTGITQVEPSENSTQNESTLGNTQSSELKSLGDEDMVISQLLDEEELEKFKKQFESPVLVKTTNLVEEEVTGGGVIDSDEERDEDDDDVAVKRKKKLKKHRRIQFSDDESSSDEENAEPDEVIDLQDMDDDEIDNVAYDSEENEIDLKAEAKKEQIKIADFVEAEAELSESEWGSADEDEKDLDQLEFEAGDEEKFDQEKMKADLEKIHMRRLLDDDTREVKLLQELLLEDGEMHGTGRQRQFKWKNIDLNEDDATADRKDEDDIYLDEEESEEQWRRRRHEREMFLKSQKEKDRDSQDLLDNSQLLKIGQKMLQRSISLTPSEKEQKPLETSLFSLQNKRGSFLNRSDHVLQRVAEYTKVSAELCVDSSKKTTKHFLFQSVSMSESFESKKRKAAEGTPNVLKKLRLSTNLSPAIKKKSERSKKLFDI